MLVASLRALRRNERNGSLERGPFFFDNFGSDVSQNRAARLSRNGPLCFESPFVAYSSTNASGVRGIGSDML